MLVFVCIHLLYSSCHPLHTKNAIPFSLALRLRLICFTYETFNIRTAELTTYLLKRGYKRNFVTKQIQRAANIPRRLALQTKDMNKSTRVPFRAANNGRSTDNVRSKLGIDRTDPWIAGHLVRSFTNSFREILIFNYLIITRDNIHVSERKQNEYKTRQISGQEIPGSRNFPRCHQVLSRPQIIVSSVILFTVSVPN